MSWTVPATRDQRIVDGNDVSLRTAKHEDHLRPQSREYRSGMSRAQWHQELHLLATCGCHFQLAAWYQHPKMKRPGY